jgi:glutamyl-tRNA synthetase
MLRFAPSPTADMHIGDLRLALFNYLIAKKRKEDFIIRIEDIDKEKNIDGKDQEILDTLGLFGIEHTQVIYASQNFRFHSAMALQLLHEKKAFSCFCSDEWIEKKKAEAKEANKPYFYDDACRNLPAELVIDNTAPFTVRIVRPDREIIINDEAKGEVHFEPDTIDSFVIMNQDKTPTYDFATAVDDMLNDISFIIREESEINHSGKQIHIRNELNYNKEIIYAHIPPLLNAQDITIKSLLEAGYLPEAISNYLISIGNELSQEIFTLQEAQEWFSLKSLSKEPLEFDIKRLREINQAHLKGMEAKELSRYVGFADADIGELARVYANELFTTRELKEKIAPLFEQREIPEALKDDVEAIKAALKKAPYFDDYTACKKYLLQETDIIETKLLKPFLFLLTNQEDMLEKDIEKIYGALKNYIGEIIK